MATLPMLAILFSIITNMDTAYHHCIRICFLTSPSYTAAVFHTYLPAHRRFCNITIRI